MRKIMFVAFGLLFLTCSKKDPETHPVQADSIITKDSLSSGLKPVSPDYDNVPTVDSTAYDLDSILKSK